MAADIFSDCFTGCLTPAACGWTLVTPPGTVTFDGDLMSMGGPPGAVGRAEKPTFIPMPPASFTVQFRFLEIPAPPPVLAAEYRIAIADPGGGVVIEIVFLGTGLVRITYGPVGSVFSGPWVPAGLGTPHTVHFSIDGGSPTLFLDGVPVALAPTVPVLVPPQAPSTVAATIDNGGPAVKGAFDYIVAATGIFPPTTVFCCPGGGPTV